LNKKTQILNHHFYSSFKEFPMKRKYLLASLLAVGAIASGAAQAAAIDTFDLNTTNAWKIKTTVTKSDDFNDGTLSGAGFNTAPITGSTPSPGYVNVIAPGNGAAYAGLGASGLPSPSTISYSDPNGNLFLVDSAYKEPVGGVAPFAEFVIGGMDNSLVAYNSGALTISLAGTSTANSFGVDLLNADPWTTGQTPTSFSVTVNGNSGVLGIFNYTGAAGLMGNPTGSFFGAVSNIGAIKSVVITPISGRFSVDNVKFGNAAVTAPEPSSMALLGLGLAALGWKARRKAAV
jgi:hypothetical protein